MRGKILNYLKALSQSGGRFESHGATGLDIDYFAGPRIPSHSCLPRFYREGAKRRHLKSFIFLDRSCERSKGCVDVTFGSYYHRIHAQMSMKIISRERLFSYQFTFFVLWKTQNGS